MRYVHDSLSSSYPDDLETQTLLSETQVLADNNVSQSGDNYEYDAIGNLIKDSKEDNMAVTWTLYGKIATITKTNSSNQTTSIYYTYDASGNRISKKIVNPSTLSSTTWYVRDASGNVISVYEDNSAINNGELTQTEAHLYCSSRLGILALKNNVENPVSGSNGVFIFDRGNKHFELSNHLGNVLVTITDRKHGVQDPNNTSQILYHKAEIVTANDYYPERIVIISLEAHIRHAFSKNS